ncbi:WXG100 family type VII secretion target [Nocardia higoensis]|uniref:WXG100 family type VII secretion target n=1 Tax=Nocardia higoensis TaxID=228599 RepID=UPI000A0561C4|nr:WXG100 family type VII secretion target [Nocardia higoensis]
MAGGSVSNESQITLGAKNDMGDAVAAIRATIGRVNASVESSRAGWQGDASGACQKAVASWEGEAARLNAILDELTTLVGEGDKAYVNLDADNEGLIAGVGAGGGLTNL